MRVLFRAGRREVEVVVADPLLLAAVIGGDGVEGAMLSSTPMPTITSLDAHFLENFGGGGILIQDDIMTAPKRIGPNLADFSREMRYWCGSMLELSKTSSYYRVIQGKSKARK